MNMLTMTTESTATTKPSFPAINLMIVETLQLGERMYFMMIRTVTPLIFKSGDHHRPLITLLALAVTAWLAITGSHQFL